LPEAPLVDAPLPEAPLLDPPLRAASLETTALLPADKACRRAIEASRPPFTDSICITITANAL
jgi:hypothetical protein